MLSWILLFLVIAMITGIFGFWVITGNGKDARFVILLRRSS